MLSSAFFPRQPITLFGLVLCAGLLLFVGCNHVEIEPAEPPATERVAVEVEPAELEPQIEVVAAGPWVNETQLPLDAWYVQSLNGKRIGYYRTQVQAVGSRAKITQTGTFELPGRESSTQYSVELEAFETFSGEPSTFMETTIAGSSSTRLEGTLRGSKMDITTTQDDSRPIKKPLEWQSGTWGVLGIEAMLRHRPMAPGDRCECRIFVPKLGQILIVKLIAEEPELTALPGGATQELIPITVLMINGDSSLRSRSWVNDQGEVFKTVTLDGPVLSTFRVSEEIGRRIQSELQLSAVKHKTAIFLGDAPGAEDRTAVYEIESQSQDLYSLWDPKVRQTVTSLSPITVQLVVHDVLAETAPTSEIPDKPTAEALASTGLIQSTHPNLLGYAQDLMADAPAGSETDRALHLTRRLSEKIEVKPLQPKVASSLETCRTESGDRPSLAILLTALLRSQNIPARVASGLEIDTTTSARLGFAMWTEAWVDGRWLPLDVVSGGVTPVRCIKILDSTLADENPYAAIMPVYEHINKIKVRRMGPA